MFYIHHRRLVIMAQRLKTSSKFQVLKESVQIANVMEMDFTFTAKLRMEQ